MNKKCECYNYQNGVSRCWGTPEKDICECEGVESHCDFYAFKRAESKSYEPMTPESKSYEPMTPEQYLLQVRDIDLRIRSLKGELKDAENEKDEEYAEQLRKQINNDIKKFKEIKLRIREEIQQIGNARLSVLLSEYYVRGREWEQVAESLDLKDPKWVRTTLRERALKLFAAKFPKYFL